MNSQQLKKRIVDIRMKNENQKSVEIKMIEKPVKKKELAEIKKNLPNQNAINLTNIELSQRQQS